MNYKYINFYILETGLLTRFTVTKIIHPVITNDLVRSTTKAYGFFMTRDIALLHVTYI